MRHSPCYEHFWEKSPQVLAAGHNFWLWLNKAGATNSLKMWQKQICSATPPDKAATKL